MTHLLLVLHQVWIGKVPGLIEHDPDVSKAQTAIRADRCADIPLMTALRLGLEEKVDSLNKESKEYRKQVLAHTAHRIQSKTG